MQHDKRYFILCCLVYGICLYWCSYVHKYIYFSQCRVLMIDVYYNPKKNRFIVDYMEAHYFYIDLGYDLVGFI